MLRFTVQVSDHNSANFRFIAHTDDLDHAGVLCESHFIKNNCATARVFDNLKKRIAEHDNRKLEWTKPTTAIGAGDLPEAGTFSARSFNGRTGKFLTTHHSDEAAALRRLAGNRRHQDHTLIRHTFDDKGKVISIAQRINL